jgi:hypothetical protein
VTLNKNVLRPYKMMRNEDFKSSIYDFLTLVERVMIFRIAAGVKIGILVKQRH